MIGVDDILWLNVDCVRFTATHPICMETFKAHPQLGRFTLRDEGVFSTWIIVYVFTPVLFRNNDCDRKDPEGGGIDSDFGCFCDRIIYAGELVQCED